MATTTEAAEALPATGVRPAPTHLAGILRQLGPGLIISSIIVGSGELIVTPKLGASAGFSLLWFIIVGCLIKVLVQVELGRYAISRGLTTLEAMNTMPGPRFIVSWLVWLWVLMYVALVFQVAGMVGGLASVSSLAGLPLSNNTIAVALGAATAVMLVAGRYRLVESFSTVLVALFTICTVIAVAALQSTPYAITGANLAQGFSFQLPDSFTTAFAAFGVIGVGASELIYYPYWCLEKGYAKSVGPAENSETWAARARGWLRIMNIDAWVSCAIYTTTTVAFYLLGAAVLARKGLAVENSNMIETLSHMYTETFGAWSNSVFLIGAFAVLYSTVFGATASNARLFADGLSVFGLKKYATAEERNRMVKIGCVLLPVAIVSVFLIWGAPVSLVFVGATAQGLMLPFLGAAALYFRHKQTDPRLAPGVAWTALLWVGTLLMGAVGLYQVAEQLSKMLK